MGECLDAAAKLAVLAFVVAGMGAAGLGLTAAAVAVPLRRGRLVAGALAANFVVAPAAAFALTRVVPLAESHAVGLILLGGAAGAPFLPRLAAAARGDAAFAVGLMLVLMVGSVAFMPVVLPLLIPGLEADAWPLLRPLLFSMLLPLAAGMALRRWAPAWATRVRPAVERVSTVSMVAAVLLLVGQNAGAMLATLGSGAALTAAAFVALTAAAGYALGGPARETRAVLGVGTGQRNVAAALVVATQNFADPGIVVMLLVSTFAGLVVLLAAARVWARPAGDVTVAPKAAGASR